ncbi:MAG: CHAP domain-containing protein [Planctomycetota bacterium]|nr:CHAP domain-containing protein [Planctomycetota bacterium]
MTLDGVYRRKRLALAHIARDEGGLALAGNMNLAGEAIEKYLAVFRAAFNENGGYTKYSDQSIGYPWCCAFVYYCCLQAGFTFPPKPIPEHRWTLGAVPVWYDWAILPENDFYFPAGNRRRTPEAGDIILFNRLIEDKDLDHIGIVVAVNPNGVTTAEGNFHNKSGLFERSLVENVNGYIRLAKF